MHPLHPSTIDSKIEGISTQSLQILKSTLISSTSTKKSMLWSGSGSWQEKNYCPVLKLPLQVDDRTRKSLELLVEETKLVEAYLR